ncbi:hypothetical protein ABPG73_016975, partial [Tetrahymena malaccensis]
NISICNTDLQKLSSALEKCYNLYNLDLNIMKNQINQQNILDLISSLNNCIYLTSLCLKYEIPYLEIQIVKNKIKTKIFKLKRLVKMYVLS